MLGQPNPPACDFPVFSDPLALRRAVEHDPGASLLISHEGICCLAPDFGRGMAMHLAALDMRLLFYMRPYRHWIVSSYSFDIRIGFNRQAIDCYIADLRQGVSAWPTIEMWGEAIGWDRMRIRSIEPADLCGKDIVFDAFDAIGLPPPQSLSAASTRENIGPPWMLIELLRLMGAGGTGQSWTAAESATAEVLHLYLDDAIQMSGEPVPHANYLSRAQAERLQALYNEDLDRITAATGTRLQPDLGLLTGQPFVPSAEAIPREILRALRSLASAEEAQRRHPGVAVFVATEAFTALCR